MRSSMPRTHLALFQKYRCGTRRRAGPPCSGSSGSPPSGEAIHPSPPVTSSSGRLVVYPPSHHAVTKRPSVATPSSRVSSDTPVHVVSSFDHFVTQWMSAVSVSDGSARNSSHGHDTGSPTAPLIVKLHSSSGVRGVGPAESTGKSLTTYCPGGTRAESTCGRRPRKPREMCAMAMLLSGRVGRLRCTSEDRGPIDRLGTVAVAHPAVVAPLDRRGSRPGDRSGGEREREGTDTERLEDEARAGADDHA